MKYAFILLVVLTSLSFTACNDKVMEEDIVTTAPAIKIETMEEAFLKELNGTESSNEELRQLFSNLTPAHRKAFDIGEELYDINNVEYSKIDEDIVIFKKDGTGHWALQYEDGVLTDLCYAFKENTTSIFNDPSVYNYKLGDMIHSYTDGDDIWYSVYLTRLRRADAIITHTLEYYKRYIDEGVQDFNIVSFDNGTVYVYTPYYTAITRGKVELENIENKYLLDYFPKTKDAYYYSWISSNGLDNDIANIEKELLNYIKVNKAIPKDIGLIEVGTNFSLGDSFDSFINADIGSFKRKTKNLIGEPLLNVTYNYTYDNEQRELNMEFTLAPDSGIQKVQITVR